jgi:phosphomannomutase
MDIFKAYDIRGIYGTELTEGIFYKIARAYARFADVKGGKVVVGRDCRKSSDSLFEAFAKGLVDEGVNVIDISLASTPMSYFANGSLNADGSVMITASHNTKEWNGCKMCRAGAVPISGATGIKDIEAMVAEMPDSEPPNGCGTIEKVDISAKYAEHVSSFARLKKPLHIAVDFANGMGIAESVALNGHGITFDSLYGEYDGDFPNHEANPLHTATLEDISKMIKLNPGKYAFGVAFDGDADRAGFLDEKGEIIPMDFVTALISRDLLSAEPGAVCFYDLRSSKVCEDIILESGGKPMMSRVGHSFIKDQMRANNAVFAGELSGHYYFRANYTAESSSMAVYALANIVSASDKPLSELVAPLRKYYQSGEINSRTSREPAEILEEIKTSFEGVEGVKIFELDGVSIDAWDSEGWWANVRMSNTEPLVRLNLEGKNSKIMEEKRDEFLRKIRA